MAKTRSAASPRRQGLDALDARDGPTDEYKQHYDTISRMGSGSGRRRYSGLERLLRTEWITADVFEAGRRLKRDWDIGVVGSGRSCLDDSGGGGSGGCEPSMIQMDSLRNYYNAIEFLNKSDIPRSTKPAATPDQIITRFAVHDETYTAIGDWARVSHEVIRNWIIKYLVVLAEHYRDVDKKAGRSTTAYTTELALKRLDPEND